MTALVPVERPEEEGFGEGSLGRAEDPLVWEAVAAASFVGDSVFVGMTRFLMVGREAEASTVQAPPESDVGHAGVLPVNVYDGPDTPVGVRVSHWLKAISRWN